MRSDISTSPLDVPEHENLVAERAAGAVVSFAGIVRDHDGGRCVEGLEYSAHPDAAQILLRIASVVGDSPGVHRVAVSHRVGQLEIGDVALACAVAADHRGQAFAVCAELVEEVKRQLPVWKHQSFADGTTEWVAAYEEGSP